MSHNAGREIAIVGGGIGGLTAALAFARMDARVTVYEQAPALTEVGAGLQITPNAARVLDKLDLSDAIAASGITAQAVVPVDGITGKPIARFDLTTQAPPYVFCHRAALIDLLARACAAQGVDVHLDTRVEDFREDGSFQTADGPVHPDLTIGADGIRSFVRHQMGAVDEPFFTGQVAWRAVVKQPDAEPIARIWMLPGRHVVTYPLSDGRMNIVAVQQRSQWADEGWHHNDDPENLRVAFADADLEIRDLLGEVETTNLWGLFRHPVAESWHQGSFALLGDAAHPTLPFLAQGANLAMEDAYVLARCCDGEASLDVALAQYQTKRRARVVRAINAANKNAVNYHLSGPKRRVAHAGLRIMGRYAPNTFLRRLSWLYDHDVTG